MSRKHVVFLAAFLTAGAALLSACGTTNAVVPAAAPASSSAATAVDEAAPANLISGTAKSRNAPAKTGDWATGASGTPDDAAPAVSQTWTQLKASKAGALDPVLVNGADLTLYRFDKDTAKPSKSNCNGDCAVTWPPVIVTPGSKVFLAGIQKSAVGTVKRADGQLQLTVGGWPIYRFAKDKKAGDTFGQGVGGTWFGVTPTGGKAGGGATAPTTAPTTASTTPPASTTPAGNAATSAILFDDANFSDNGASQGVSGKGCQNVARAAVTSSISTDGSLKLWTGKDCTGKSTVITGDVNDLSTIGFDNSVVSVFFS
jgi:predicted lipoprotein with Yx(FWY)xxD motif